MHDTLLIELVTEELPPKSLSALSRTFAQGIFDGLKDQGFVENATAGFLAYATPRRLAVSVDAVRPRQEDRMVERKGPAVSAGFDAEGKPTPALQGFARSCGVASVDELGRQSDAKGEYFVFRSEKKGEPLADHLSPIIQAALKKLPIAKMMRWGESDIEFVRPVHRLVVLHGDAIVPIAVLGLTAGRVSSGHRFLGDREVTVDRAVDYETVLERCGKVVPNFDKRRQLIRAELEKAAGGDQVLWDEALLDEVTALVEYPRVYRGEFNPEFLQVPSECLVLSMKQHQKYFPMANTAGKLLPAFLVVSNLVTEHAGPIVSGNERVLRARLSDAKFFFDQDRRTALASRVPQLGAVVYHNRLGSQLERVMRIKKLAGSIACLLRADVQQAERAGELCKADLLTDMVGEFPELQGTMGRYYALHDGEPGGVADAIEAHYRPRFAGDALPGDSIGASVALADKLDTLVGMYGIGQCPTGDKDPFGLRRHALGTVRILAETPLPLDLLPLLELACAQYPTETLSDGVVEEVMGFVMDRMRGYLREKGFDVNEVEAVLATGGSRVDRVAPRLEAVRAFKGLPESESLAAANKRIRNILKKTEVPDRPVDVALLQEPAEKALFEAVQRLAPRVRSQVENEDYTGALCELASVRQEVDTFFDQVMVMADEPLIRDNRLALLNDLGNLMNQVADISRLAA